jgi:hypothetical protein
MKAGHKTTEFYIAAITALIPVINTHFGLNIDPVSMASIASVVIGYIWSRTKAKQSG